jgi:hypothetical protein
MPESQHAEQRIEPSQTSSAQTKSAQVEPSTEPPQPEATTNKPMPKEIGGRGGLEPTRYGDWEKNGRCIDF